MDARWKAINAIVCVCIVVAVWIGGGPLPAIGIGTLLAWSARPLYRRDLVGE